MAIVTRETGSGLVLAEEAVGEAWLNRALKEIDRRLVLQYRPPYYVVVCQVSDEYAPIIVTWMDENGNPLPASSGLLEEVKRWRPEARSRRGADADEHNRRHVEQARQLTKELGERVVGDHRGKVERGRVTVSMGPRTKKRQWQRNPQLPGWLRRL